MGKQQKPAIWFPTVRSGSGTDVFTERLVGGLRERGLRAEITWLPHRVEFAPWSIAVPAPPTWANVVHVNTWLHPRFLPKQIPVVATLHHAMHEPELQPYKGLLRSIYHSHWLAPAERRTMLRADSVIAVSMFAAESARRYTLDRPIQVIHNGVDVEKFRPSEQRLPRRPFRLLYVGKWVPLKGVDLLAPIMRLLGTGFELRYTGGDVYRKDHGQLPANAVKLGRLHGDDAVVAAMQDADALLLPSRSEGFGLVAAEAMACGLPVIATRGSSLTEVIGGGAAGILCSNNDISDFARAVQELASNPSWYTSMSEFARKHAVANFSLKTMIDEYLRVYLKYINTSSRLA